MSRFNRSGPEYLFQSIIYRLQIKKSKFRAHNISINTNVAFTGTYSRCQFCSTNTKIVLPVLSLGLRILQMRLISNLGKAPPVGCEWRLVMPDSGILVAERWMITKIMCLMTNNDFIPNWILNFSGIIWKEQKHKVSF